MSVEEDSITQLMEITGLDHHEAGNVLSICDGSLEAAINYHLENEHVAGDPDDLAAVGGDGDIQSIEASENASVPEYVDEDGVRAPIPAKREQLLQPEDDNFRVNGGRKRRPQFTVCPLRNFAREAELQEQQLLGALPSDEAATTSAGGSLGLPRISTRSARMVQRAKNDKRKRLEDLFRPPLDLLFCGTFHAVRSHATEKNRWLIVNLQDQKEFKSQVLNRDIWPELDLKELILKYFVLWQVSVDNPEGLRFKTFYHCHNVPYVCIIDPRTGEEKHVCTPDTPKTFREELLQFLNKNSYTLDSGTENSNSSSSNQEPSTSSSSSTSSYSSSTSSRKRRNSVESTIPQIVSKKHHTSELSEDDQLALAIRNSLKESQAQANDSSDEDNELVEFSDNSNSCFEATKHFSKAKITESHEIFLGAKTDPITKLQFRLPNESQDKIQIEWPCSTKLAAIRAYMVENYPDLVKGPYKIITAFPRKDILDMDQNQTLMEANLHPTSILHLHLDD